MSKHGAWITGCPTLTLRRSFKTFDVPVCLSSSGDRLLTTSGDGRHDLWDVPTGNRLGRITVVSNGRVAFSPEGTLVAVDSRTPVMDPELERESVTFIRVAADVVAIAFQRCGPLIAVVSGDQIGLCDRRTPSSMRFLETAPDLPCIGSLSFSPDGARLAGGSRNASRRAACVWDLSTGACTDTLGDEIAPLTQVLFSPDGQSLLLVSPAGSILMGGKSQKTWVSLSVRTRAAAFCTDVPILLVAAEDDRLRAWDLCTDRFVLRITRAGTRFSKAVFSEDGPFVCGGAIGELQVWGLAWNCVEEDCV